MDGIGETEARGDGVALGKKIGGEHARAGARGEYGVHQADGTLADHQHRIVGGEIEQFCALEHGVHRLNKCRLLKRHAVGNAHHAAVGHDEVHHANVLGKAAAGRLKASSCAGFLVERALRWRVLAAVVARAAGNVMEAHHTVAYGKVGDSRTHRGDYAGHFVAEDARRRVRAHVNLLEVGAANAAGGDLDQQFARPDARDRHGFKAHVVNAAIDHGAHDRGNVFVESQFRVGNLGSHSVFRCDLVHRENRAAIPRCFGKPFYYFRPSGGVRASTRVGSGSKVQRG